VRSSHTGPVDWDAETYDRVSDPQVSWGAEVLGRLPLHGDETVLDAGCGSGRLTSLLAERIPEGRLLACDASPSMVEKAREALGARAEVFAADLTELRLDEPVDLVFSNAVFHWIRDHDLLFARLHDALRPGGRLVAQCGGAGNVASLAAAIQYVSSRDEFFEHLGEWERPWNFRGTADMTSALRRAGFDEIRCWLESKPVRPQEPLDFVRVSALGPHLEQLPEELRDRFVEEVVAHLQEPVTLDYVRLNIEARRP
jgi:trans-aconitate 2-methyltransferase